MRLARAFLSVVFLVVLVFLSAVFLTERVPPATIGIKQNLWGGGGVVEKDYGLGFHIGITVSVRRTIWRWIAREP